MTTDMLAAAGRAVPRGSKVLCAVSGGADSMSLLHLLFTNREALGIAVCAAHFEHGIRGEESLRDCRLVENYCGDNGIELCVEHCDIPAEAKKRGKGTEETARELRYEFLHRSAEKLGCELIATAHNADDNAETMLFNLARGTGGAGLCGIPPVNGRVIRPLLEITRSEIERYIRENSVPCVEDSSNLTDDYSRNRIRHHVMPVMRSLNPAFSHSAAKTAKLLRRDEEFFLELAEKYIAADFDGSSIPLQSFRALQPSVASRVVRKLCPRSLSMEQVEQVLELSSSVRSFKLDVPGLRIWAERERLYFGAPELCEIGTYRLREGETLYIEEAGIAVKCEKMEYISDVNNSFKTYLLKCANIYGTLFIGPKRPGDKIRPAGRNCTKSLKALFLERKLTTAQKMLCPVIRDEKGVLLIPGIAADERTVPVPGDEVYKITIEKI